MSDLKLVILRNITTLILFFFYRCHNLPTVTSALYKILPNYCATYLPIAMVMIANPIMYVMSSKNVEMAVAVPLAQVLLKKWPWLTY